MEDFYIHAVNGAAVIVSPNHEHVSIGVHIRGGSVRIDMTPEQARELIEAISQSIEETV